MPAFTRSRTGTPRKAEQAFEVELNPELTNLQADCARKKFSSVPRVCVVTGGTGFVGMRLVEMLVERGADKVISYDIVDPPADAWRHEKIEWVVGDICDLDHLIRVTKGADCVWHNAAAVGPFHPRELYFKVNYQGTLNVIEACKRNGVPKCVMSSSPSTRFTGADVDGLTEEELPSIPMERYLQTYAETKAMGEAAMRDACCDEFMTVAVAPHQVYGPRDNLFLPNVLETGCNGKLRIFGKGKNRICFTHVDNYCHGLIIAEKALYTDSPALGKFYIVTDGDTHPEPGQYLYFWKEVDKAIQGMGFPSLWSRIHYPLWFMTPLAYVSEAVGWALGTTLKLNRFNVRMLTMHRWFKIDAAEQDLGYSPIISYDEGWEDTINWFRKNWLPKFQKQQEQQHSWFGIAKQSQRKIDIQAEGTGKAAE